MKADNDMTTQEKIAAIFKDQYGNYGGRLYRQLIIAHAHLRFMLGDEVFLEYLEKQKKKNPRPKYQIPENN